MISTQWKVRLGLLSTSVLVAFAPVSYSSVRGLTDSTAECTSCCKESTSKCVKCTEDCLTIENAYDSGGGRCPQTDLN